MSLTFKAADILLPKDNFEKWSVIACDQYTSRPEYWEETERTVGDAPSALRLIFPEAYLGKGRDGEIISAINEKMTEYLSSDIFKEYENALIYVERTQRDGRVRAGLVGAVDLDEYDFRPDSKSNIRATERTVMERLPARVAIRRGASIELPHVMMLIDDPAKTVIEPLTEYATAENLLYAFTLMQGGGHLRGYLIPEKAHGEIFERIAALKTREEQILFAVGDGNHSLASAKLSHEESPNELNRYALVELVNLHSDALDFEPIYRVAENVDPEKFIAGFEKYLTDGGATLLSENEGSEGATSFTLIYGDKEKTLRALNAPRAIAVACAQEYIDGAIAKDPTIFTDYIHGEDEVRELAAKPRSVGFIYDCITKDTLFEGVEKEGVLPRKTFSMGNSYDKRYYTEARRIIE